MALLQRHSCRTGAVQGVPWLKNVLLRIVLRALDRSLTNEACNVYRDAIYARLHEGTVWYWAAKA